MRAKVWARHRLTYLDRRQVVFCLPALNHHPQFNTMFSPRLVTPLVARRQAVRWSTQAVRFFASDAPVVPIREQLKNALMAAMRAKNTHETTIVKVSPLGFT